MRVNFYREPRAASGVSRCGNANPLGISAYASLDFDG
jgi:hypothetical protein